MRLSVYIDGEYAYGVVGLEENTLNENQILFLKNPIIISLSDIGYVPEVGSTWDGTDFSKVEKQDYQSFSQETGKEYFAIIVDSVVEKVLGYNQEREIAMMSSNPFFILEDENSSPIKNPMSRISG
jgi:hypothetical protein